MSSIEESHIGSQEKRRKRRKEGKQVGRKEARIRKQTTEEKEGEITIQSVTQSLGLRED